jgi:hypothetical protein
MQPLEMGPGSKSRWDRGISGGESAGARPVRRKLAVSSILKAPSIGSEVPLAALLFQGDGVSSLPLGICLTDDTSGKRVLESIGCLPEGIASIDDTSA